MET
ncbi:hypothetical protein YPPY01_1251, partial [Yersinia pestis PY-01]|jgi:hypothetical protein